MVEGQLQDDAGRLPQLGLAARRLFFRRPFRAAVRLALIALAGALLVCLGGVASRRANADRHSLLRNASSLQSPPGDRSPAARKLAGNLVPGPNTNNAGPKTKNAKFEDSSAADRAAKAAQAETLIKEGQALAAEWTEASRRRAVEKFAAARSLWHLAGDVRNEVRALDAMGRVYISLSEYKPALGVYNEALTASKDVADEAQSLNGISSVYTYLGEQKKALTYCTKALQISQAAGDRQGQAESLLNMGEIYYFLGDIPKAQKTLEQSLALNPDPSWRNRALTLVNLGYVYFDLRDMDQALARYKQALTQSRSQDDRWGEAFALTAIGGVYSYLGNKQTALEHQNEAVNLFRVIGDRNGEAVALNGLGYVYRNLAEYQKSLDCYLRAMQLFHLLGNREYENFTITRIGKAYQGLGDTTKALEYYQLALTRAAGYTQTRAQALDSIGSVFEEMRQPHEALRYYKQSLGVFRAAEDKMGEASILNSIGEVYASFGQRDQALKSYREALSISQAARDRRGEVSVILNIAQAQRDEGEYQKARETIEGSLGIIESLRTEVASSGLRASYFASVRKHYELYIDILMQLDKSHPGGRFAEDAFSSSEQAHARSLLELLTESRVDIREGADPLLLDQLRILQQDLNLKADKLSQLSAGRKVQEAAELEKEISQLTAQYDQLEVQIRLKSPRYAALVQPRPLTLREVQQKVLDDNSLLLEYALGDEQSYLWAVTRTEVFGYELPGRAEIENKARSLYSLLTASQPLPGETFAQTQERVTKANEQLPNEIANLSRMLLWPVAGKLGTKRLLVVPDGALQYIPFQVLTVPAQPGNSEAISASAASRPLVLDHEIVNEPSASALALLLNETASRKSAPDTVAVFADPVFESDDPRIHSVAGAPTDASTTQSQENESHRALRDVGLSGNGRRIPRLQSSRDEADAIMSAAPWRSGFKAIDFEASRAAVMSANLGRYRIIHFATHGLLNDEHPELSGIVLSLFDEKGEPQDGFLRLYDIYNLKLPVDLVVLSACNTGLGKDVRGEGLVGLTRGFMYAGASSVVASLWKVDDEATAELMRYFYGFMLKDGLTPAAALRKAQVTMSQQKRWQSPYYWSGFIIQGQYNQTEATRSFHYARWASGAGGLMLLSLATFFVWKRRRKAVL
jgi:CHAT domain-containing protein/Tfp pilus assembly protein PilF